MIRKKLTGKFVFCSFMLFCFFLCSALFFSCKMETLSREMAYGGVFNFRVENSKAHITGLQPTAGKYIKDSTLVIPPELAGMSVGGIDAGAFKNSSLFKRLRLVSTTPPSLGQGALDGIADLTILVPPGTVSAYSNSQFGPYAVYLKDQNGELPKDGNAITSVRIDNWVMSYSEDTTTTPPPTGIDGEVTVWVGKGSPIKNFIPNISHTGKRVEPATSVMMQKLNENTYSDGKYFDCTVIAENNEEKKWRVYVNNKSDFCIISLDANGGKGGQEMTIGITDAPSTKDLIDLPTKFGYNFDGYWGIGTNSSKQYYDKDGKQQISWDQSVFSAEIRAKWEPKKTTITFDPNGIQVSHNSVTATYDSQMPPVTLVGALPPKVGYSLGYYDAKTGGTQYYGDNMQTRSRNWDKEDTEVTLYAQWKETVYTADNYTLYQPVDIISVAQLKQIADLSNNSGKDFSGKTVLLHNDLNVGTFTGIAVGSDSRKFSGTFDGNGKTVTVIISGSSDRQGFIGTLRGTSSTPAVVKNLTIAGALGGNEGVGGIAGHAEYAKIEKSANKATVLGRSSAGGIVGYAYFTTISLTYNTNIVETSNNHAGGIAGRIDSTTTIERCFNSGTIVAYEFSGGILGMKSGFSGSSQIDSCYNIGLVRAKASSGGYAGGIIGRVDSGSSISTEMQNCYNIGLLEGVVKGGLVGKTWSNNITFKGVSFFLENPLGGNSIGDSVGSWQLGNSFTPSGTAKKTREEFNTASISIYTTWAFRPDYWQFESSSPGRNGVWRRPTLQILNVSDR